MSSNHAFVAFWPVADDEVKLAATIIISILVLVIFKHVSAAILEMY